MKLSNVSQGTPRVILMAALAMLFLSVLLDIAHSAANINVPEVSLAQETPTTFGQPALVQRYQQTIAPEALAARLYFFASDFFEGRETGTRGQRLAAHYLASQYRALGLKPLGNVKASDALAPAAYFQSFPIYRRAPKETRLEVFTGNNQAATSRFSAETQDDLSYFMTGKAVNAEGGVVFAGYGIADAQLRYDDYAALRAKGISLDGKWLMVLADEPLKDAQTSLLPTADRQLSKWSAGLMPKRKAALSAGKPAGLLVVRYQGPRLQGTFADAARQAAPVAQRVGQLSLHAASFPPVYAISDKLANQILSSSGQTIEGLRQQINQSLVPNVFEVKDVRVKTTVEQFAPLETENVLGLVEGSDPRLKDETIVVSAHYDHLGLNPSLKGDQIFNGAADDGSGVVALLELAQAFMKAKRDGNGPRRSILFVGFTGEERGLLGSSHYAHREPLVPLERTIAEINMDGVGGIDPRHPTKSKNYIYIVGARELSQELIEINERVKEATNVNLDLTDGPSGFNSDQFNFQAQHIPFIYYSTGFTEYYHTPQDEPHTIDYEHLARVTRLVFGTVWQVANQDARLRAVKRSELVQNGYVCPPCPFECDEEVYARFGECPVCGMGLVPNYSRPSARRTNHSELHSDAAGD